MALGAPTPLPPRPMVQPALPGACAPGGPTPAPTCAGARRVASLDLQKEHTSEEPHSEPPPACLHPQLLLETTGSPRSPPQARCGQLGWGPRRPLGTRGSPTEGSASPVGRTPPTGAGQPTSAALTTKLRMDRWKTVPS